MSQEKLPGLVCTRCGESYPFGTFLPCRKCGGALLVRYDLETVSEQLSRSILGSRVPRVWKYEELLPLGRGQPVSLGEGGTPLVKLERLSGRLGVKAVHLKDEGQNPSGSFKDRYATVLVSHAAGLGEGKLYCFSSGNHAAALSCYCARAGLTGLAFVYPSSGYLYSKSKMAQSMMYGAKVVTPVRKPSKPEKKRRSDFYAEAYEKYGWYPAVTQPVNPYLCEGYKTMAYEISEQLGWKPPDAVVMPTESGDGLLGLWKGFKEFRELGFISEMPRIISSQWGGISVGETKYSGHDLSRRAIEETDGAIAYPSVRDDLAYVKLLAVKEGLLVEAISAGSVACIPELVEQGVLDKGDTVVSIATGSGIKHPELADEIAERPLEIEAGTELEALARY